MSLRNPAESPQDHRDMRPEDPAILVALIDDDKTQCLEEAGPLLVSW